MIYNVDRPKDGQKLPVKGDLDMAKVMATFLSQMRLLLGVTHPVSFKRKIPKTCAGLPATL